MKKIVILIAVLLTVAGIVPTVSAQPQVDINLQDAKELIIDAAEVQRKAVIVANVSFTEAESGTFWPIYNQYRSDIKVVNEKMIAMIGKYAENYENLSDQVANELMAESMKIEAERMALKQGYIIKLQEVLPVTKVAILFQIENKIEAVVKYELAATIPMVIPPEENASVL
jgi:hypothetical protein